MTSIILLSINYGKCCEKSCENVSLCFCTDQNEVPIKNVFEVNEELGDEEQTSKGMPVRGGGGMGGGWWWGSGMVTSQTEPCINNDNFQTRKFRY